MRENMTPKPGRILPELTWTQCSNGRGAPAGLGPRLGSAVTRGAGGKALARRARDRASVPIAGRQPGTAVPSSRTGATARNADCQLGAAAPNNLR